MFILQWQGQEEAANKVDWATEYLAFVLEKCLKLLNKLSFSCKSMEYLVNQLNYV